MDWVEQKRRDGFCSGSFYLHRVSLKVTTNSNLALAGIKHLLRHFVVPGKAKAEIKFYLFCSNEPPNLSLGIATEAEVIYTRGDIKYSRYKQLWLVQFGDRAVMAINRQKGMVLGWVRESYLLTDPGALDPVLYPVFELLKQKGLFLVHAAALAREGDGLLFPGKAKCGKTSLTLYLLREGFKFLSDDRCFLQRNASRFEVLSFPQEIRVYPPNVADLPEFQFLQGDEPDDGSKRSFDIERVYPDSIVERAKLKAVVFPCWDSRGESRLEAVSPNEALIEMLPLTLEAFFPDTARAHFEFIADLVENMPCFRLYLGSDKEKWHHIVKGLIR